MPAIPLDFYRTEDPIAIARQLLGALLITEIEGIRTVGRIVETEAYRGWGDAACHAHAGTRSPRTEVMYGNGGTAYVYLCYGIHNLFNIVTNGPQRADAVLIRALEPLNGLSHMLARRGLQKPEKRVTMGPGSLSKAMGITRDLYGMELVPGTVWLEWGDEVPDGRVKIGPRVGVDYAGEDAKLPWRFWEAKNPYVSRPR